MLNYYRALYPCCYHTLSPLLDDIKLKWAFKWIPSMQIAFSKVKLLLERYTTIKFHNLNDTFHIDTDASELQLGAIIYQ